jgi:hypothetical protein
MPLGRRLLAVLLVVCASACTKFDIKVDRDPAYDVARKTTWDWVPIKLLGPIDQRLPDPYLGKRLVATVAATLASKGYNESPNDPDLWVNYRLLTDTRTDLDAVPAYGLGWWSNVHADWDTYERGSLVLDVIDVKTRALVWRGIASARLLSHASFEKRSERTQEVARKLLESFPNHQ